MPVGSPGMEVEGSEPETYDVIAFDPAGERLFAHYCGRVALSEPRQPLQRQGIAGAYAKFAR